MRPEPVLVIHGVNVRDRHAFEEDVSDLNRKVGEEWRFVPVFWGDLGAKVDFVEAVIPHIGLHVRGEADNSELTAIAASFLAGELPDRTTVVRSGSAAAEIVADAATSKVPVRSAAVGGEIQAVIKNEWDNQRWLPLIRDVEALEEIGRAIAEGLAEEEGIEVRGGEWAINAVRRMVSAVDKAVGAVITLSAGNLQQYLRRTLGPHIGRFLGDIFVYESHRDMIQKILRDRVRELGQAWGTVARPVTVLAHSLGGVVTFDAAIRNDDPLHIRNFVTFGSQAAFFHVINRRYDLPAFAGNKVTLKPTIGRWLNVWQPLDPLAFIAANVFQLATGGSPDDQMIAHQRTDPAWTHSVYWTSDIFAGDVRDFLQGG